MPQDPLQPVKDSYNGPTIGPMSLLQKAQYQGNRPDWLNKIIEMVGAYAAPLTVGDPSGGLGNINLAGDLIPFASKVSNIDTTIKNLRKLLTEHYGINEMLRYGQNIKPLAKTIATTKDTYMYSPELIESAKKYIKFFENQDTLKNLNLPHKIPFRPVLSEIPPDPKKIVPFKNLASPDIDDLEKLTKLKDSILGYIKFTKDQFITPLDIKKTYGVKDTAAVHKIIDTLESEGKITVKRFESTNNPSIIRLKE